MSRSPHFLGCAGGLAATLLAIELSAPAVRAEELQHQPQVAVRVSACSEPFALELRRMLALELGDLLDDAPAHGASKLELLEIVCAAEQAQISARGVESDQVAHNDLRFDAFPSDAAPRAVALAALEALRAVDPTLSERLAAQAEAHTTATPSVAASTPTRTPLKTAKKPAPIAHTAPAEKSEALPAAATRAFSRITLGGLARHFVSAPSTTLFGARLELSRRFSAPWDVGLDLDAAMSARRAVTLGTVQAKVLSSAAWLAARVGSANWSASAGLGGRVGLVDLDGAPSLEARGHHVRRPWLGALFVARSDHAVGSFTVGLAGEGGYALAGAQGLAAGAPALRLDGLWLAVSVNVGLRL